MNLNFKVNQSIDSVFQHLTDMEKFAKVHPVIRKIDHTSENNYLVHETLKIGFIPFPFKYPATVDHNYAAKKVTIRAVVMKLTKVEMNFTLTEENNITTVNEVITFKSILPVKSVMQKVFRKQHALLFDNIGAL